MANVQDVAAFFIDLSQKQNEAGRGDLMTHLRLQKLLYFAQGWHLARHGRPLFHVPIKAWQYGPVVPDIYHQYKEFGRQGIVLDGTVSDKAFTPSEYDLLLDVAREYDPYSTSELVRISHADDAPWSHTAQQNEIPCDEIQAYFTAKEPIPCFDDLLDGYPMEAL